MKNNCKPWRNSIQKQTTHFLEKSVLSNFKTKTHSHKPPTPNTLTMAKKSATTKPVVAKKAAKKTTKKVAKKGGAKKTGSKKAPKKAAAKKTAKK